MAATTINKKISRSGGEAAGDDLQLASEDAIREERIIP